MPGIVFLIEYYGSVSAMSSRAFSPARKNSESRYQLARLTNAQSMAITELDGVKIRKAQAPYRILCFKRAKRLNVSQQTVNQWRVRGMISAAGAQKVHNDYKKYGCQGYRASFCRPDLRFDSNGKPLTKRCDKREMLRVVRMSDYEPGGFLYKPESTNCHYSFSNSIFVKQ
ncbi:UNVERIFIED_ASMBLY: hypothetical protein SD1_32 [Shigella phage 2019SD1]|uniref:Uncharacterized protein n=1 Tax=Shigella phage 2019SD1 TaxID=2848074 RepID=A0A6M5C901_9CAUD|nr:transcriptional regulator [Shigella phage 2019SD1]